MKKFIYLILSLLFLYSCKKSNSSGNNSGSDSTNTPGAVSTFAGSPTSSPFTWPPTGICSDSKGNIFVSENNGAVVVKITAAGSTSTFAGSGVPGCDPGTGTAATFTFPYEICSDAQDNIYVADYLCSGIKRITPNAVVTLFAASDPTHGIYLGPQTICSDPQGNLYSGNQLGEENITKTNSAGTPSFFAGNGTNGTADGSVTSASFAGPTGICADGKGNVYVADAHRIRKISGGQVTTVAGSQTVGYVDGTGTAAEFGGAMGLCADGNGNVYIADVNNNAIRMLTPAGVVSTIAGSANGGYQDGDPKTAMFSQPSNLCFGTDGNLYITDYGNSVIRKITMKK
ncbi:MAG: hypothetical protein Q8918_02625 [Bacteroidota bacterium]|nr:hypothetical protein [Bacteroidota bacterium]MDP4211786.1 hypothetical protein [Bacteroidota bacterium]MDP4248984.1 hypothetical protein [Bacteroidota bacterium]